MNPLKILQNKRLIRYLGVAIFIVCIEMATFQVVYIISHHNYMLGTVISFVIAVILNWILGRLLVFGASKHHASKEFAMVLIASVVGLGLQSAVVYGSVNLLHLYPLIGKGLSICFSFFWNYWFRAAIIYKHKPVPAEEIENVETI